MTADDYLQRDADDLEHILAAALARLDARQQRPTEESTMGRCYGRVT